MATDWLSINYVFNLSWLFSARLITEPLTIAADILELLIDCFDYLNYWSLDCCRFLLESLLEVASSLFFLFSLLFSLFNWDVCTVRLLFGELPPRAPMRMVLNDLCLDIYYCFWFFLSNCSVKVGWSSRLISGERMRRAAACCSWRMRRTWAFIFSFYLSPRSPSYCLLEAFAAVYWYLLLTPCVPFLPFMLFQLFLQL